MGLFSKEDHRQNQIDIYEELIEEKQDELGKLDGVEGAEVESRREKLAQQISNLRVALEQVQETAERSTERGEESFQHDDDHFDD